jgi:hypothetical protein
LRENPSNRASVERVSRKNVGNTLNVSRNARSREAVARNVSFAFEINSRNAP